MGYMNKIMSENAVNVLGRCGENDHVRMLFDVSEYAAAYPNATYSLLNLLPESDAAYPVQNIEVVDDTLYWTISDTDVAYPGYGKCELIVIDGTTIAKSVKYVTQIMDTLDGSGKSPDPWGGIITELNEIKSAAQEAAQDAEHYAEQAAQHSMGVSVAESTLTFSNIET